MRRLKVRALPHAMENQVRRQGSSWTRVIYLVVLIAIAVWLIDLLFGSSLFLKSEGMVLAPSATVATEYPATVRSIEAKEGDKVEKGRLIARISRRASTKASPASPRRWRPCARGNPISAYNRTATSRCRSSLTTVRRSPPRPASDMRPCSEGASFRPTSARPRSTASTRASRSPAR